MKTRLIVPGAIGLGLLAAVAWWYAARPSIVALVEPPLEVAVSMQAIEPPTPDPGEGQSLPPRPSAPLVEPLPEGKSFDAHLAELAHAFRSSNPDDHESALGTLLPALAAQDPGAVASLVVAIHEETLRDRALDLLARIWSAQDRAAALAWADALPRRDERETALTGLCLQTATHSAREAVETLSTHIPGDRPLAALEGLAQQWAEASFDPARQWALANEPGPRREGLVARLAFVQAKTDPAAAASLVIDELPPGDTQNEAAISVLHQWAKTDVPSASRWVNAFEAGPLRDRALLELQAISRSGRPAER